KLSALAAEKQAGRVYRLPTEAEWEYACRAGTTTAFHTGNSLSSTQANFGKGLDSRGRPCKVGSYKPNAWGLYDMHGNVWEVCSDRFSKDYYETRPKKDPKGPAEGKSRVVRGGGWNEGASFCRASSRVAFPPDVRRGGLGFRVVCVVRESP